MTYPRAHLVDFDNGGFYHCISRCVRRAWLCGFDDLTGQSFEHRRAWLEERILALSELFAIDVYGYAVMSNHYHIVVHVCPHRLTTWSNEEVVQRWLMLTCKANTADASMRQDALLQDPERIEVLRERLGNLSWFMRYVNEPLARTANEEDDCKGRFWEGRFKSIALLDDGAIQNCLAYVDLNPYRAGMTEIAEKGTHTSIHRRVSSNDDRLSDLREVGLDLACYRALLTWTVAVDRGERVDVAWPVEAHIRSLGQNPEAWLRNVRAHRFKYRAYGLKRSLDRYVERLGQRWLRGALTA